MADHEPPGARSPRYRTSRMEAFSDGVLAIAATLLVLEIEVPEAGEHLLAELAGQWPAYLAYLVSFATIGAVWFSHTVITEYLDRATSVLLRLNLLLLMLVAFLPYSTRLLVEYLGHPEAERVATTIYGINLLLISLLVSVVWRYAVHEGLIHPDAADLDVRTLTGKLTPELAGYLVMIGLGLFLPVIAVLGYLLIAIYIVVPIHALWLHRRRVREQRK